MELEEKAIQKIRELKDLDVTLTHDPKVIGNHGLHYDSGERSITFGRMDLNSFIGMCDRLIYERKEELSYDPTIINNLLIKAYKK